MEIPSEIYEILGILTYLDYPKYLKKSCMNCITDIFDKMEEEIEDLEVQVEELEKYYMLIKDQNDKDILLHKINEKKQQIADTLNQLNFIK